MIKGVALSQVFWRILYEWIARHLPNTVWFCPLNIVASRFRVFCVRRFISGCDDKVRIDSNVTLAFGCKIGNHVTINRGCRLASTTIDDHVLIAPKLFAIMRNHEYGNLSKPIAEL